jgi:hypothetical protein
MYKGIWFLFLDFSYKVGVTNSTPLKKNLVLEICKKKGCNQFGLKFSFLFGLGIESFVWRSFFIHVSRWFGIYGYCMYSHLLGQMRYGYGKGIIRKDFIVNSGSWFFRRFNLIFDVLSWCLSFFDVVGLLWPFILELPSELRRYG